ncbi:MAG: RagB/SusD family nutrient uptake outer membrane protein [Prevotellaceae bacterium]|jgi:hypothetical protein|nr:RagB/SusD family nutrient uptake outer membrane protein [Prevotellaceae bacterium]
MKKLFYYFALLALPAALYSCGDDDKDPIGEITEENIIRNDGDAANLVKAILKTQSAGSGLSFLTESLSEGTVSFEGEETADGPLISRLDVQGNNVYVGYPWDKHYPAIASANELIEKISAIEDGAAADGKILTTLGKNTALGGLYFARALSYFYLVRLYGPVPLYTKPGETGGSPAAVEDIYKQIEADLKLAEELLPTSTGVKTVPSKYAAQAILARVYLTWAQYSSQGDLEATPADQAKLASAEAYADKVINSGQFFLLDDFTKNWGRHNKNGFEHIYNQSYVLGDARPGDGGNHQSHCAFSFGFNADPNTQPTHIGPASYDLYLNWDGKDTSVSKYDRRRDFSYTTALRKPNTGGSRLEPEKDTLFIFNPTTGWLPIFGKGIDRSFYEGPLVGPTERDLDRIEIRYADVLLIKAEALIEQNKNLTTAKDLINQIRERAYKGAPGGAAQYYVTASAQNDLRAALRQERKNEFVYEQTRWFDLVRWHVLDKTIKEVANYTEYQDGYAPANTPGTFFAKVRTHLRAKYNAVNSNPGKYYRFPYPETALASNPNLPR